MRNLLQAALPAAVIVVAYGFATLIAPDDRVERLVIFMALCLTLLTHRALAERWSAS